MFCYLVMNLFGFDISNLLALIDVLMCLYLTMHYCGLKWIDLSCSIVSMLETFLQPTTLGNLGL